jgi:hypothetical protein
LLLKEATMTDLEKKLNPATNSYKGYTILFEPRLFGTSTSVYRPDGSYAWGSSAGSAWTKEDLLESFKEAVEEDLDLGG